MIALLRMLGYGFLKIGDIFNFDMRNMFPMLDLAKQKIKITDETQVNHRAKPSLKSNIYTAGFFIIVPICVLSLNY